MRNSIIPHDFKGNLIQQLSEDTLINEILIPKGYVNATQICQTNGKRWAKYMEFSKTPAFLEALEEVSPPEGLTHIIVISEGANEYRGTWVCLPVAMNLAQWCSPIFAAWAAIVLSAVISGDYEALTEEAAFAQAKLQEIWDKVRAEGILTRRGLTNAIQDWYQRNPGATSRPPFVMYAQTTNAIYQALWDMTALELEEYLECDRHESRNNLSATDLRHLERAEAAVMDFIDEDNIKPIDAVALSNIRRRKEAPTTK